MGSDLETLVDFVKRIIEFFANASKREPARSTAGDADSAVRLGEDLPSFRSLEEAQQVLFQARDKDLVKLQQLTSTQGEFVMDYSPESLQKLETWYFDLYDNHGFEKLNVTRMDFERFMAMYFGEVSVKNVQEAKWIVRAFAFTPDKFEIGIKRRSMHFMLTCAFRDLVERTDSESCTSLFKEYRKYFS